MPAAGVQLALGRRDAELLEEDLRQLVVVVLAGVDDDLVGQLAQPAGHRSRLDELRAIADDRDDQPAASSSSMRCRSAAPHLARALAVRQLELLDRRDRLRLAGRRGEERLARRAQVVHRAGPLLTSATSITRSRVIDASTCSLSGGVRIAPSASTQKIDDVGASRTRPCGVTSSASSKPRSRASREQSMLAPYESDLMPSSTRVGAYSTTPSRTRSGVAGSGSVSSSRWPPRVSTTRRQAVELGAAALRRAARESRSPARSAAPRRAEGSPPNARAGRGGPAARTACRRRRG